MPRTPSVGPQVYQRVLELETSGVTRTDAFKQVADELSISASAAAANFYRYNRQEGKAKPGKPGRPKKNKDSEAEKPKTEPKAETNGSGTHTLIDKIVGQLEGVGELMAQRDSEVEALNSQVAALTAEVDELRAFKAEVTAFLK